MIVISAMKSARAVLPNTTQAILRYAVHLGLKQRFNDDYAVRNEFWNHSVEFLV